MGAFLAILGLSAFSGAAPQAAAGLNLRQPLSGTTAAPRPGVRAQVPTQRALDATVAQLTGGLSTSDIASENACRPAPGQAACASQVLVLRANHKPIHPKVAAHRTFTQVFPSRPRGIAPAAGGSASTPPPVAGSPAWIQQAYDLTYLSQTGGVGATVAIIDAYDDPTAESDLAVYRAKYGLPPCTSQNGCFTKINQNGQTSPLPQTDTNWAGEITLDLDAVSAVCPNCHILLVEAFSAYTSDLQAALQRAATWPGVKQISNSWVSTLSAPPGGAYTFPGIATVASTGDWGLPPSGTQWYPAALPGVTAAGGTAVTSTSGAASARGYAESAWPYVNGWGDSAGCNTQSGIVKPSYQPDTGCTGRSYADVSADAQPSTGLSVYGSLNGGWGVWGGTSLSSPLIAAYLAVTGIDASSPSWAYANSALLNDPVGGSIGSCPQSWAYICTAGIGYDGPTGIGSISGALVKGAPGIGGPPVGQGGYNSSNSYTQSVAASAATLTGGVYPNSLATTVFWQYGTSTSYGQQTSTVAIGAGQAPILNTTTLTGLSAGTQYHYRLVAQNSAGTTYGYDYTFTTPTASASPPVNTVAPAITGTPQQGQTLSAGTGTWNPGASSYTYRWQRSTDGGTTWSDIGSASSASYTPSTADLGVTLRVTVTATNPYGSGNASSAAVGPVLSGAPVNTIPPFIGGQPTQGQLLTVSASWNPAGASYTYQWQRSSDGVTWANIAGAGTTSYTPVAADEGAKLRVVITATNAYGTASATSAAIGPVLTDPPVNTAAPAVTGTTQRSFTLTASTGTWTGQGVGFAYRWQRSADGQNWTDIAGATAATYTLAVADEGLRVRALVIATSPSGTASTATNPTQIVAPFPPANTAQPTATGTPQRGYTLSATAGTWTGAGNSYTYQWQRDAGEGFENIPGATGVTYLLSSVDVGTSVRVLITATNPDATISEASDPTPTILTGLPVNTSPPTISGTALRGSTLGGALGMWTGIGNVYAWQWQRSSDRTTWTDIAGANTYTYTLAVADVGGYVRLMVGVSNPDGTASASSQPTALVQATAPSSITLPTVSGTARRGSTLSSTPGTWNGIGNTLAYQWQRSSSGSTWSDIDGATASTYTLTRADEGATLRLSVTATNPDGSATAASRATAAVQAAAAVSTSPPTITGTALRGAALTGNQGTWSGIGNTYAYQWQESGDGVRWSDINGATDTAYTPAVADEGMKLRLLVSASNPDGTLTASSAATAPVLASAPTNASAPLISGGTQRGAILSSSAGSWSGIRNTYAYQWQRSANGSTWTDITGANAASYTVAIADEGLKVRLTITATNPDGSLSVPSQSISIAPPDPPVSLSAPILSGTAQRSSSLSVTQGGWAGAGNAYAYQWQRSSDGTTWTDIDVTGTSYPLGPADVGMRLRVKVTATNPDGTMTATSSPSPVIQAAPPVNATVPTVTGTAQRSVTLTGTQGVWGGLDNTYTYQWQRSANGSTWTDVGGATALTYTLGTDDEHTTLRLKVTATNPDGSLSAISAPTSLIQDAPPQNTSAPAIGGTPQRTLTLTASQGTWTGIGNTYAYQWQRSANGTTWVDVGGATDTTYVLSVADEGMRIRVVVTATNPDGTLSIQSAATAVVQGAPPISTSPPTISGTAQRAATLTAAPGAWSGFGNTYAYQWQRSANGSAWVDVSGATDTTYVLGVADEGMRIRVIVTTTNPDGKASAASAASAAVQKVPPVNTIVPTIGGTTQRGYTLSASQGTWSGTGNTYAYQWQRSGPGGSFADVVGATTATYVLGVSDENATIRVVLTATNPDGSLSVASAPTASIATAPPVNTALPVITGSSRVGAGLSASAGTWWPAGASVAYQWQRGTASTGFSDIRGATSASYTAAPADALVTVRVVVTASNVDGSATATSLPTPTIAQPPNSTRPPSAPSGTLMDTYKLTADPGGWDTTSATFAYSWLRCDPGATSVDASCAQVGTGATYTLAAADVGHPIAVAVTASSVGGASAPVYSALTDPVAGRPLTNLTRPAIAGTPQVPQTVTVRPGSWSLSPTSISYSWQRCDLDGTSNCSQAAAGSMSYTLSAADRNHAIVAVESVTSPGRAASAASSPVTVQDQPLPQATVAPSITGTAQRGSTLTASPGAWSNNPTLDYQWLRCAPNGSNCQAVGGATGLAYLLTKADEGYAYTFRVSATNTSGTVQATATATAAVAPLLPVNTSPPVIKGAAVQQGVQLGIAGFDWQATSDTTFRDTWERCGADGGGCQPIAGATNGLYTPVAADVGHTLVVIMTATNADGSVNASSDPTTIVLPAAPRWRTLPTIAGTGTDVGDKVTIAAGTWSGPAVTNDVTQLMRCTNTCTPAGPADVAGYQIADDDLGAILRVRETASNGGGPTVVWSARYVGPVSSAAAASTVIAAGQRPLRNADGDTLATAQLTTLGSASAFKTMTPARVVKLRRARGVTGKLRAWVCPTATATASGPPPACTPLVTLRATASLRLPASMKGKLRIVVVRRGR